MERRNFLALLSTPALIAVIQACSDKSNNGASNPPAAGVARSNLARTTTSPDDALEASSTVNALGMDLFRLLAGNQPGGNLVLSPASIAVALTMTAAGARAATLSEMVATVHIDEPATIHHAMNAMLVELASRETDKVAISIANSLWAQQGVAFQQPFLDVLAAEYAAGLNLVDYKSNAEAARTEINTWVGNETKGRIPQLLGKGAITPDARLTLVNAVYMKAPWLQTFAVAGTVDGPFTVADGSVKQVPMMVLTETLPYTSGDGFQAIELAYDSDHLTMLIFLPEKDTLAEFEQTFVVGDATSYLSPTKVVLRLPRFDITSSFSLADALQHLGMNQAFTTTADFSGITTEEPLMIGAVIHQANITVDENGTEAAAATAVATGAGAMSEPQPPLELTFDRPFVFAIRDRGTEAILFVGRIGDPTP